MATPQEKAEAIMKAAAAKAEASGAGTAASEAAKKANAIMKAAAAKRGDGDSGGGVKPPSLAEQGRAILGAVPRGLLSLGGSAVRETVNTAAQVGRVLPIPGLREMAAPAAKVLDTGRRPGESAAAFYKRTHPLTGEILASGKRTVGKVTEGVASLAPGGLAPTDTRYGQAVREGRILGEVLEDVGNVALGGAVGARVAGRAARSSALASRAPTTAARVQRVATATQNFSRFGGNVADTPARAYVWGAKAIGAAAKKSGVGTAVSRMPLTQGLTARVVNTGRIAEADVPGTGRATVGQLASGVKQRLSERADYRRRVIDPMSAEALQAGRQLEYLARRAVHTMPDSDARNAMLLIRTGQIPEVEAALAMPPDQRATFMRGLWGVEHAPNDRVLAYVKGYVDDTLEAGFKRRMDQSWEPMRRIRELTEQAKLEGRGMKNPLSPEQLGDVPMEGAIARHLAPLRERTESLERELAGDPDKGVPGMRAQVAAQRARVGAPDLEAAVPSRAIGRVERAARTAGEAGALRRAEERTAAAAARAEATVAAGRRPFVGVDPDVLREVEQMARDIEPIRSQVRDATEAGRRGRQQIAEDDAVSPAERAVIDEQRDLRKREAEIALHDEWSQYDNLYGGGERLRTPPPRQRVGTDPITRKPVYARTRGGGEWDWWDDLPASEQRRLVRNGWIGQRGLGPDELADMAAERGGRRDIYSPGESVGREGGVTEAMEAWVEQTRRIDELRERARTGGLSRTDELSLLRERGTETPFDQPGYSHHDWEADLDSTLAALRSYPKGSPAHTDALRHYSQIAPPGLNDAARGLPWEEAFDVAARLSREASVRRFSPEGRLSAAEERVRQAVDARSAKGLRKPERAMYDAVQAALRGEAAETAQSSARARAINRIIDAAAPALRAQGEVAGRAQGRARALGEESSLAGRMAAKREERLAAMDPRSDLVAGMATAQRRLAPQIARDVKANIAENQLARAEYRLGRLKAKEAAAEAWLREGYVDPFRRKDAVTGRFATPLLNHATSRRVLTEMADELDSLNGAGAGDYLRGMIPSFPDTMKRVADYMTARGFDVDDIEYVPGTVETPLRGGGVIGMRGKTPEVRTLRASKQKREGIVAKSYEATARDYWRTLDQAITNEAAWFIEREYARRADSVLTDAGFDPDSVAKLLAGPSRDIALEMKRRGFTAWSTTGRRVPVDSHGPDTLYLPSALEAEFRRHYAPTVGSAGDMSNLGTAVRLLIDAPTRTWKHLVLAVNPMWHVGNMVGAAMLATGGAGVGVRDMARFGRQAREILRREQETGVMELPARLHGAGQAGEVLRGLSERPRDWSALPERIGSRRKPGGGRQLPESLRHPIRGSYEFNQFVDDWARATVYLAKKAKGVDPEQAVVLSLRAMGDFATMSPFERNVARRVMPFYAWSRHITKLAGHLAIEHPVRVAWMMHIGATFGGGADDAVEGVAPFMLGALKVGENRYVSLRSLNPYSDMATLPFSSPKEFARGLNPMAKGVSQALGVNLGKFRTVTRPPGTGRVSEYGGEEFTPSKFREMLYWASQQTGWGRAAYTAKAKPYVRYDTGQPMKLQGRPIELEGSKTEGFLRGLGVPFLPTTFDQERHTERVRAVEERNKRKYERYIR